MQNLSPPFANPLETFCKCKFTILFSPFQLRMLWRFLTERKSLSKLSQIDTIFYSNDNVVHWHLFRPLKSSKKITFKEIKIKYSFRLRRDTLSIYPKPVVHFYLSLRLNMRWTLLNCAFLLRNVGEITRGEGSFEIHLGMQSRMQNVKFSFVWVLISLLRSLILRREEVSLRLFTISLVKIGL